LFIKDIKPDTALAMFYVKGDEKVTQFTTRVAISYQPNKHRKGLKSTPTTFEI